MYTHSHAHTHTHTHTRTHTHIHAHAPFCRHWHLIPDIRVEEIALAQEKEAFCRVRKSEMRQCLCRIDLRIYSLMNWYYKLTQSWIEFRIDSLTNWTFGRVWKSEMRQCLCQIDLWIDSLINWLNRLNHELSSELTHLLIEHLTGCGNQICAGACVVTHAWHMCMGVYATHELSHGVTQLWMDSIMDWLKYELTQWTQL